jgi:hypothetical protein
MYSLQRPKTLQDRLKPTIDAATAERNKFKRRCMFPDRCFSSIPIRFREYLRDLLAYQQSIIINGAIGLQVIVGALTTGVAASGTTHVCSPPSIYESPSNSESLCRSELW